MNEWGAAKKSINLRRLQDARYAFAPGRGPSKVVKPFADLEASLTDLEINIFYIQGFMLVLR